MNGSSPRSCLFKSRYNYDKSVTGKLLLARYIRYVEFIAAYSSSRKQIMVRRTRGRTISTDFEPALTAIKFCMGA